MSRKNANFPILIVVIVLVAVVAQLTRHSTEPTEWTALRRDLTGSLARLWEDTRQEVELVPGRAGVVVQARVTMPPNLRARQQRWNYPFVRFVALRHPKVAIEQVEVSEAASRRKISEIALGGLLAEVAVPPREDEERNCLMMSRTLTTGLEEQLGRGQALVLVDARRASSQRDDAIYYGKSALPHGYRGRLRYEFCVVSCSSIPAEKWRIFEAKLPLHSEPIRRVLLP